MRNKLDPEIKLELLIKLAFGIPIEDLVKEYNLTKEKIVNLRKNNYVRYNEFFNHWKIDPEVASLGLTPKSERALSIFKKFYKNRVKIESGEFVNIYFDGKECSFTRLFVLVDAILKKDNINNFMEMSNLIKNFY